MNQIVLLYTSGNLQNIMFSVYAKAESNGSFQPPFKTINSAAQVAQVEDTITVYEGICREWIDPKHGGTDPGNLILYRAANGAIVYLKGWRL